jgi:hypothetical protein
MFVLCSNFANLEQKNDTICVCDAGGGTTVRFLCPSCAVRVLSALLGSLNFENHRHIEWNTLNAAAIGRQR